jgi:3-deoxy-manno-octulosonate cytidylyltransferase (CMP-KDO synthetase)
VNSKVLAVIPARYASTRLPGKVLALVADKPLVAHVYERATAAHLVTDAIVATDDARVAQALAPLGIPVAMTRPEHPSGTDRIAEVAENSDAEIIVNVQGDEPLIDPETIDATIQPLLDDSSLGMATVRRMITRAEDVNNPNVVKVVCDARGRALYFSRCPIPAVRDAPNGSVSTGAHWQHIGMYVYRREFLLDYAQMAPTPLEELEKLEQLRALENGYEIAVVETEDESIGVDDPEDLDRVRAIFETS